MIIMFREVFGHLPDHEVVISLSWHMEKDLINGSVAGAFQELPPDSIQFATVDERACFRAIQEDFRTGFAATFPGQHTPKAVVIIPSLTLDQEILEKVSGHVFYEERMLCLLLLLRMPATHVIFVSSVPVDPVVVDYYLHLLPGITGHHARNRLTLLSCYDAGPLSLTQKILDRPRLMERIRRAIPLGYPAHLSCFNVTAYERTLSVRLGIPIYGCDPDLYVWGTKSRSRKLFRECGITMPDGFEDVGDIEGIIQSLTELKVRHPKLKRAVIKMNDGFSGDGNAVFSYAGANEGEDLRTWIRQQLPVSLKIVAEGMRFDQFMVKFEKMQGIVEAFIEGGETASPSVQCRITPLGQVEIISTHDQALGGESGQVFLGAYFPAQQDYSPELGRLGRVIAGSLRDKGVIGRFSVDFLAIRQSDGWNVHALEINLRKGGTTHPYLMLQYLTDGKYDEETGAYTTANGQSRYYYATDNLRSDRYHGITPPDLLDIAIANDLHFDATLQEGVVFHLITALSQFGKLGMVCIGGGREKARDIYAQTVAVLDRG